jgi:hypothetical protein
MEFYNASKTRPVQSERSRDGTIAAAIVAAETSVARGKKSLHAVEPQRLFSTRTVVIVFRI